MTIERDRSDPTNITHTLRTAVIDPGGRLVKIYTGNDWTPQQLLADLKAVADAD
jgi:cytochrome oxidase Cu insertion factor (SCO1/SenC/PrrC family)